MIFSIYLSDKNIPQKVSVTFSKGTDTSDPVATDSKMVEITQPEKRKINWVVQAQEWYWFEKIFLMILCANKINICKTLS